MTTYTDFVTAVTGLSVSGMTRTYTSPPQQVTTADLPAMYPRLPTGGLSLPTLSTCTDSGNERVVQLVVLVEAAGQGTQPQNYAAFLAIIDALESALRAASDGGTIMPLLTWTIASGGTTVGETPFWSLTATITGTE